MVPEPRGERPIRIGYARTSSARQELASQLEALRLAHCHKVFKVIGPWHNPDQHAT